MPLPTISLVIPTFNAAATLERTLHSLRIQDYPHLELILMDGGSKDATLEIARQFETAFTHIISEPDRGQANALNKGFQYATGDLWGWICADDELAPGALHHFAELFQANSQADCVTGGCLRRFWDGTDVITEPRPDVMQRISYHNGIEQPSTLWTADLHRRVGGLDESYNFAFDWDLWNRFHRAQAQVITTPTVLSHYYFSDTNKTSTGGNALVAEMYRVIKKFGPARGYLADVYRLLYRQFDLHGCYDTPPTCDRWRSYAYRAVLKVLLKTFGTELIYAYNWNFASKQERDICWFR
jgi:glycosyltransferase involved in cell wall biosynthesis